MPLENTNPTATRAWKALAAHYNSTKDLQLKELFKDGDRAAKLSIQFEDFLVDYSKNRVTEETLTLLYDLAAEMNLTT